MLDVINESTNNFLFYKYKYIVEMFQFFDSNHKNFCFEIDAEISRLNTSLSRICESCFEQYDNRKRKCDKCGGKVSKATCDSSIYNISRSSGLPKYLNIGQNLTPNHMRITIGNVIPVNPNSYENMKS